MVVLCMDFTTMHLYDTLAQIKSDAASRLSVHGIFGFPLRLVETIEYLIYILVGNTATGIADADVKR